MVAGNLMTIRHDATSLSYRDVVRIDSQIRCNSESSGMVIVDLTNTCETSTAALAKLILVRRCLMQSGRDLLVSGLSGQAVALYRTHLLTKLLPHISDT